MGQQGKRSGDKTGMLGDKQVEGGMDERVDGDKDKQSETRQGQESGKC